MSRINQDVISRLRGMARKGESVPAMFYELKAQLGQDVSIVEILNHMRSAFCLSLAEAKPFAALTRTDRREITDEAMLDELVRPKIDKHRGEWDTTEMNSTEYEQLVADLVSRLTPEIVTLSAGTRRVGRTNRIAGQSGYEHQIDVSVDAPTELLLVECKCWSSAIPVPAVLTFAARCCDIRPKNAGHKHVLAAMVTTVGFDPGVEILARYFDILLWHVKSETEFVLSIKTILGLGVQSAMTLRDSPNVQIV